MTTTDNTTTSIMFVVVIILSVLMLPREGFCENISSGKTAKQINNYPGYPANRALISAYSTTGSLTNHGNPPWWEVDLRGYFTIDNITITAANNAWTTYMRGASIEVMDKDIQTCQDAQVIWCGNVSDTVAPMQQFSFSCDAPFPVRFVRVWRYGAGNTLLNLGHVDVQGRGAVKRYRSYYEPTLNRKVNQVWRTTSAMSAAACGIKCHQDHSCIHFSFSTTVSSDVNCMMTNQPVPLYSVVSAGWILHKLDECR